MKDVLICIKPKTNSERIVNATMSKYNKNQPTNISMSQIDLTKINILKYIIKHKLEKVAIYIHESHKDMYKDTIETLISRNVKVMYYNNDVWYIPERVPGNKLKTNNYYLYDKIIYEAERDFKLTKAYKVHHYEPQMEVVEVSPYDIEDPLARKLTSNYTTYKTEQEAKDRIVEMCKSHIDFIDEQLQELEKKKARLESKKAPYIKKVKQITC